MQPLVERRDHEDGEPRECAFEVERWRQRPVAAPRDQDAHGQVVHPPHDEGEGVLRGRVEPLHVVHRDDNRAVRRERSDHRQYGTRDGEVFSRLIEGSALKSRVERLPERHGQLVYSVEHRL